MLQERDLDEILNVILYEWGPSSDVDSFYIWTCNGRLHKQKYHDSTSSSLLKSVLIWATSDDMATIETRRLKRMGHKN
jgi:hypothetical protein